jgi:hypothetical protein
MKEDRKDDALGAAYAVYFGTWVPFDTEFLERESPETPESALLEKEVMDTMPSECKTMLNIILNLPEEMWQAGGFINAYGMKKVVKNITGWPMHKVYKVETMLYNHLKKA